MLYAWNHNKIKSSGFSFKKQFKYHYLSAQYILKEDREGISVILCWLPFKMQGPCNLKLFKLKIVALLRFLCSNFPCLGSPRIAANHLNSPVPTPSFYFWTYLPGGALRSGLDYSLGKGKCLEPYSSREVGKSLLISLGAVKREGK